MQKPSLVCIDSNDMMKLLSILLLVIGIVSSSAAQTAEGASRACPMVKAETRRLPDLNTPRSGHAAFCVNGELTVAGGHTTGFVPTKTAEYFSDGEWHQIPMVYTHDGPFFIVMKSGRVLIGGGFEKEFGIGQSFSAEFYHPATHSFEGSSILDTKRVGANAVEIDSGRVVISGNWYHDDNTEIFDGKPMHPDGSSNFHFHSQVAVQRYLPYIFRTSVDDAIIFSERDIKGALLDSLIADRLKGGPTRVPLFNKWRPLFLFEAYEMQNCFVGDETKDYYAYLLPVTDNTGQIAIAKVEGEEIALLPTSHPVPMLSLDGKDSICYRSIVADRQARRAYLVGTDSCHVGYVFCIDYGKAQPAAPITLYYTDPMPDFGNHHPVLMPDGNLAILGGKMGIHYNNYTPVGSAWLILVNGSEHSSQSGISLWLWLLTAVIALVALCLVILRLRARRRKTLADASRVSPTSNQDSLLLSRICQLMEEQQPYLNSKLRLSDLATLLDVNQNDISACINMQKGCSFSTFINGYRIDYAKQLLISQPDKKIFIVATESGFTNEQTFHTNFKQITGQTPRQWLSQTPESTKDL